MSAAPSVSISPVFAGGNQLNQARAAAGFAVSGTATGIEVGQVVTLRFVNAGGTTVYSTTTLLLLGNTWSATIPSLVAQNLPDGSYTLQASSVSLAGLSATASTGFTVDETSPVVSSIATNPSTATLAANQPVTLTLTMSEPVNVSTTGGTPKLTLSNGGTATYVSGSGTNQLVYSYTTVAGQDTNDLTITGSSLNGGTIVDNVGNSANMSGSAGNPPGTLAIYTTAPVVSSVTTSPGSGNVGIGQTVALTVNMSHAVNVSTTGGTPTLALNNGGTAVYVSGSGTGQLVFTYTVASGQNTSDLTVTGLALNGGTIADAAGNTANVSGAAVNPAGTLAIDATPPLISINPVVSLLNTATLGLGLSIGGTSNAENGQVATIQIVDSNNNVVNTLSTPVNNGAWSVNLTPTQALALSTGTYTIKANVNDLAGNSAVQASVSLGVDTISPLVLAVTANPANADLNAGKVVTLTLTMSEITNVSTTGGTPTLSLNNGATATYVSGSGTNLLNFQYTVQSGQDVADLAVTGAALNGAVIADAAGNAANLTGAAVNPLGILMIDTTAPAAMNVTATPSNGDIGRGSVVILTVNMSQAVLVNTTGGAPTLALNNGGTATYLSGSGTTQLLFTYTVGSGQDTPDLSVSSVALNGGTIADLAGNAATMTGAVGAIPGTLQVDTTPPTITITPPTSVDASILNSGFTISGTTNAEDGQVANVQLVNSLGVPVDVYTATVTNGQWSISVTHGQGLLLSDGTYTVQANVSDLAGNPASATTQPLVIDSTTPTVPSVTTTPSNGQFGVGQIVTLTVGMTEPVTVSTTGGTPTLSLNSGGTATYIGGSGGNQLVYQYTVAAGQNASDLTVTGSSLNGGTITDLSGNPANMSNAVTNPAGTLVIDTTAPTVSLITAAPSNGDVGIGQTVTLTVNTSQPVTVSTVAGTPTLTLNNGGVATYVSGSGTNQLLFQYTVAAGQDTPDLAITGAALNGGVIADAAGNLIDLTGAASNPAGTLQIDATPPTITVAPLSNAVNATTQTAGFTLTGTSTAENGQSASIRILNSQGAVVDTYSPTVNGGAWSLTVSPAQAMALADGQYTVSASVTDQAGNVSLPVSGTFTVDATPPVVTVNTISGDDRLNATELAAGFTVSGTATGAPDGQTAQISILNGSNAVVATATATISGGVWSTSIPANVSQGLADGSYTVRATAQDSAGNTSLPASQSITVDTVPPTVAVNAITPVNALAQTTGFAIVGSSNAENWQQVSLDIVDGNGAVVDHYTPSVVGGVWSAWVTSAQAAALSNGTYTVRASVSDAAGNPSTVTTASMQVSTGAPTVTVAASPNTGAVSVGQVIGLTMTGSSPLVVSTVNGTPTITLSNGGVATYVSGSGTNQLLFQYTVAPGQDTNNLAVTGVSLNGGALTDTIGNIANLSGAVGSVASGLSIDTVAPASSGVTTSIGNNGAGLGQTVTIAVNMTEPAIVNTVGGTPTLTLSNGGLATYVSGSGTNQLLFHYTVGSGQDTTSLGISGTALNGGTILDAAGNAANLSSIVGALPGNAIIDSTPPVVTISPLSGAIDAAALSAGVTVSGTTTAQDGRPVTINVMSGGTVVKTLSATANNGAWSLQLNGSDLSGVADGAYQLQAAVSDMAGNAATPVTTALSLDTTPPTIGISAITGDDTINASEAGSGFNISGTSTAENGQVVTIKIVDSNRNVVKTFNATVNNGAWSASVSPSDAAALADGAYLVAGDVTDAAGNAAVEANRALIVNTSSTNLNITPTILAVTTNPPSGTLGAGQTMTIMLGLNEPVNVDTTNGTPTITLSNGGVATYVAGSATNQLSFNYTVGSGQTAANLSIAGMSLNSGTISDTNGLIPNLSTLTGNALGSLAVDAAPPSVSVVGATPAAGDLGLGQTVLLTVTLNKTVFVSTAGGVPALTLNDGGTAAYVSGSGTQQLTFQYTVGSGQNTPDLTVTGINLNGGSIYDQIGQAANLSGLTSTPPGSLIIDSTPPVISITPITSTINAANQQSGFSIAGLTDAENGQAATISIVDSNGTVVDSYTAVATNEAWSVNVTPTQALGLADGAYTIRATISDKAGNASTTATTNFAVDGTPPTVTIAPVGSNDYINAATADSGFNITGTAVGLTNGEVTHLTILNAVNEVVETIDATVTNGAWSVPIPASFAQGLANGVYTVEANASDAAGNPALTALQAFTVDTAPPTISVTNPGPIDAAMLQNGFTISGVSDATNGQIVTVQLVDASGNVVGTYNAPVQNGAWTVQVPNTTGTSALLPSGLYSIHASVTDVAGNVSALATQAVTADSVIPTVTGLLVGANSGAVGPGQTVDLTVVMTEPMTVTTTNGVPTLHLSNGGTAVYVSGSGTNALVFRYTVGAGQDASSIGITSTSLNGGVIEDAVGNDADLSGLLTNPPIALTIDTTAPTVSLVAVTSNSTDVGLGQIVTLIINTSDPVTVNTTNGTPTLALNNGGVAIYVSGSGTNQLVFQYTVASGQDTTTLAVSSASLNGGTITDAAGNAIDLSGATAALPQTIKIDSTPPQITIASLPTINDNSLQSGFTISGTTTAENGQNAVVQLYILNGNGVPVATFTSPVVNGGWTVTVPPDQGLTLANGAYTVSAQIADMAGNESTPATETLTVDGTAPRILQIAATASGNDLGAGQTVTLTVTMDKSVNVSTVGGTPMLSLSSGGAASYVSGSGTNQLVFTYTVAAGQNAGTLSVNGISLNGGAIADLVGNAAFLPSSVTQALSSAPIAIDTTAPVIISVTTNPTNADVGLGDVVTFTVNMSQATAVLTANGVPTLALSNGGVATYVSGSGTTQLQFQYTVGTGQDTPDVSVTGLNLNGGTIADLAGNLATLTGAVTNPAGTLKIDATPPVIAIAPISAPIDAAALNAGFVISGTTTAEDGQVATVQLKLIDGTGTIVDSYTAAATNGTWSAHITHGQGESLPDGTYQVDAIISDLAGNISGEAVQTLTIDSTSPTVADLQVAPQTGDLAPGDTATFVVQMSEAVNVSTSGGIPTLTLNNGGVATYAGGSGTNQLTFTYTVGANQDTAAVAVVDAEVNGGSITDMAGNNANLSGAVRAPDTTLSVGVVAPANLTLTTGATDVNGTLVTNTTTPVVRGKAIAHSVVHIYAGTTLVGSGTADSSGNFAITTTTLPTGVNTLTATATTSFGAVSTTSPSLSFTVDISAPIAPSMSAPDAYYATSSSNVATSAPQAVLTGAAEGGSTINVYADNQLVGTTIANATTGVWTVTTSTLSAGQHVLTSTASDTAGNVSSASAPVTVLVASTLPISVGLTNDTGSSGSDDITSDSSLSGTTSGGATVKLSDGATVLYSTVADYAGHWTAPASAFRLADGLHTLTVVAADSLGDTGNTTITFNLKTTIGNATSRNVVTNLTQPVLGGTAEAGATIQIGIDGQTTGSVTADSSGVWTFIPASAVSVGSHQVTATEIDLAGNSEVAQSNLIVLAAPQNGSSTLGDSNLVFYRNYMASGPNLQIAAGTNSIQLSDGVINIGTETNESWVARLYRTLLGRDSDNGGLSYWNNMLGDTADKHALALAFINTTEGQSAETALTNSQFVDLLYSNGVQRSAESTGYNYWLNRLDSGDSRANVLADFADTEEDRTIQQPYTTQLWVPNYDAQLVIFNYNIAFGRNPDAAGFNFWTNQLQGGMSIADFENEFTSMPEYTATYGGKTNDQLLTSFFQNGLGRNPTAAELQYYQGSSAAGMLGTIAQSQEATIHLQPNL